MKLSKIATTFAMGSIALGVFGAAPAQAAPIQTEKAGDIAISPMWWNPEWDYRDTINGQMAMLSQINAQREAAGLPALKYSNSLNSVSSECLNLRAASGLEYSCYNFNSPSMLKGWKSASQSTSFGVSAYDAVDNKLMKRTSERAKILDPKYTHVGFALRPVDPLDKSNVQIVITFAAYPGGTTSAEDEELPPTMFPM
ncbi:Cysteine-rich secretory protein family [Mycobacteroides abscessus subsp. abscessus]|nr:Cysteine-rich secretory protein family [Mycobacteroides abscessus subsp. abscessus]